MEKMDKKYFIAFLLLITAYLCLSIFLPMFIQTSSESEYENKKIAYYSYSIGEDEFIQIIDGKYTQIFTHYNDESRSYYERLKSFGRRIFFIINDLDTYQADENLVFDGVILIGDSKEKVSSYINGENSNLIVYLESDDLSFFDEFKDKVDGFVTKNEVMIKEMINGGYVNKIIKKYETSYENPYHLVRAKAFSEAAKNEYIPGFVIYV